jgi:hypothetical protein
MTQLEFIALCEEHCIDPGLAIENDNIRSALTDRDDDLTRQLLTDEF